uniref:Uncharacterized protein n=1 Tax=Phasianus colchicus TaxID=9054 RepID=A0A669PQB0_PHACC
DKFSEHEMDGRNNYTEISFLLTRIPPLTTTVIRKSAPHLHLSPINITWGNWCCSYMLAFPDSTKSTDERAVRKSTAILCSQDEGSSAQTCTYQYAATNCWRMGNQLSRKYTLTANVAKVGLTLIRRVTYVRCRQVKLTLKINL